MGRLDISRISAAFLARKIVIHTHNFCFSFKSSSQAKNASRQATKLSNLQNKTDRVTAKPNLTDDTTICIPLSLGRQ